MLAGELDKELQCCDIIQHLKVFVSLNHCRLTRYQTLFTLWTCCSDALFTFIMLIEIRTCSEFKFVQTFTRF